MNTMFTTVPSHSLTCRIAVLGYGVAAYVIGVAALLAPPRARRRQPASTVATSAAERTPSFA